MNTKHVLKYKVKKYDLGPFLNLVDSVHLNKQTTWAENFEKREMGLDLREKKRA